MKQEGYMSESQKLSSKIHNILFEDEEFRFDDEELQKEYEHVLSTNDIHKFYVFAEKLYDSAKDVPPKIVEAFSKDEDYSFKYAMLVIDEIEVPINVIKGFSSNFHYCLKYAMHMVNIKLPIEPFIITNISKNQYLSFKYAHTLALKGENVPPEIIHGISKDVNMAFNYTQELIKKGENAPPEILQSISQDPIYAFKYAHEVLHGEDVPLEIIQSISKSPHLSFQYAKTALKWKKVPPEIIESIYTDPEYAVKYAGEVLKWENVPPEILQSIYKNTSLSDFNFIEDLPNKNEIIDILKNNKNFVKYFLNPKKLAEQYNNQMSGFIMHATNLSGVNQLAKMQINEEWGEICVSTLDSDVIPLDRNLCLLGQADIRLLFDFDCYSRIYRDGDKKRRRYATRAEDVDLEKSKRERIESSVDGGEFMDSKYYDEGFAQAKDIEWLAYVDVNDEYENTDDEYLKQLKRITKAEFDQLLKSGQIIKYLYDLLHKDDDTHEDDYSDLEDELLVKENNENTTIADIKESIHNILFDS
jgi:hypothetical protein